MSDAPKKEIERKFLVLENIWNPTGLRLKIRQGYLSVDPICVVRVRVTSVEQSDGSFVDTTELTVKGKNEGITRPEFPYSIPLDDASWMLDNLCQGRVVEKTRYRETHGNHVWEIDVFGGKHQGGVLAEVEMKTASDTLVRPEWLGREVSDDPRYYNSNLVMAAMWPKPTESDRVAQMAADFDEETREVFRNSEPSEESKALDHLVSDWKPEIYKA